ncbi:hypothetical protein OUY22_27820 [Nonomuraea sp. MCN248]|uniref:Uncharacterized protein n=1 Tax=Nonomuraea corallina TaxID=2989783 RepID=A0ABT4SJ46_9ACTN|nr:hypothetical protein [Nonomuraea corallina]MDA0637228.1 hypothetical protein [Nonomuraea corallina]
MLVWMGGGTAALLSRHSPPSSVLNDFCHALRSESGKTPYPLGEIQVAGGRALSLGLGTVRVFLGPERVFRHGIQRLFGVSIVIRIPPHRASIFRQSLRERIPVFLVPVDRNKTREIRND